MKQELQEKLEEIEVLKAFYHQQNLFLNRMYKRFGLKERPSSPRLRFSSLEKTQGLYFPRQINNEGKEVSPANIALNYEKGNLIVLLHEDSHHLHNTFTKGVNWNKRKQMEFYQEVIAEIGTIIYLQKIRLPNYWKKYHFKEKECSKEFHKIKEKALELFNQQVPLIDIIKNPETFIFT